MADVAGPLDIVLDILPLAGSPAWVRTAAMAVRPGGRVILMGGVSMAGGTGLELPYPWLMRNGITVRGQLLYPADTVPRLVSPIRAGLVSLERYEVTTFGLDRAEAAVEHAPMQAGPFGKTAIRP
ncbi:hypothetical protein ACE7GA_07980 [Roseomonas sp. CCTCC AB2023176]|uniref:hypothetical protein n=1 Tax=Roseomonas sp. CCTCC AB2023176 TaxID=3342640 RepID=UPI0035D87078